VAIGDNIVKACSEAIMLAYGVCTNSADPYLSFYKNLKNREFQPTDKVPKLMFTILNGGKALGSKVKFSKFYLILEVTP
jgi:hypothetical protein